MTILPKYKVCMTNMKETCCSNVMDKGCNGCKYKLLFQTLYKGITFEKLNIVTNIVYYS